MKIKIGDMDVDLPGSSDKGHRKGRERDREKSMAGPSILGLGIMFMILFTIISPLLIASVGAGERGVRFNKFFGGVEDAELGEGWHIKAPWVSVTSYNVKTQEYTMSLMAGEGQVSGDDRITAISKDGLSVDFDITVLYHIIPDSASEIHKTIGYEYEQIIIRPVTRTAIRDVAGNYGAMEMHTKRAEIGEKIYTELKPNLASKNIEVEQVLVRNIIRPQQIERAIENKLQAEQEAQKMEFVIQKETKEAERKEIEADGISRANEIIGQSLTQNYLSWYWITNLDKHNSVIYVPVSDQGFPMFKDVDSGAITAADKTGAAAGKG